MISALISMFDTPVICHVFMPFLGSFVLQGMFLSLQVFAFEGQNMKFTVKILLTCTLYCDAGPAVIKTVYKYGG